MGWLALSVDNWIDIHLDNYGKVTMPEVLHLISYRGDFLRSHQKKLSVLSTTISTNGSIVNYGWS